MKNQKQLKPYSKILTIPPTISFSQKISNVQENCEEMNGFLQTTHNNLIKFFSRYFQEVVGVMQQANMFQGIRWEVK